MSFSPRSSIPPPVLPPCDQRWAHSVVSVQQLVDALSDPQITAIETDILLSSADTTEAICAHPPNTTSDLTVKELMEQMTETEKDGSRRKLKKHLKLDIKEIGALEPTLACLPHLNRTGEANIHDKTVFLNADILVGPGRGQEDITVPPYEFLEQAKKHGPHLKLSLGWKVDVCWIQGYTHGQVEDMITWMATYQVNDVVLALNARLLVKHMAPFELFLQEYPQSQLLVWTGAGEPPIARRKQRKIQHYFRHLQGRVGFDVQITKHDIVGVVYDLVMLLIGFKNYTRRLLSGVLLGSSDKEETRIKAE